MTWHGIADDNSDLESWSSELLQSSPTRPWEASCTWVPIVEQELTARLALSSQERIAVATNDPQLDQPGQRPQHLIVKPGHVIKPFQDHLPAGRGPCESRDTF